MTVKSNEELIREWFADYVDFGEEMPVAIEPTKVPHKYGSGVRCTFTDGRVITYLARFAETSNGVHYVTDMEEL